MQIPIIAFITYDLISEHLPSSSNIFRVFGSPTPISTGHSFFFHLHLFFFTFQLCSTLLYSTLLYLTLLSLSIPFHIFILIYILFSSSPPPVFSPFYPLCTLFSYLFYFIPHTPLLWFALICFDLLWLIWFDLIYFTLLLFAFLPLAH